MTNTCASSSASTAEYLVSYGLTGELGRFAGPAGLARGARVVIRSPRGVELGDVLRPASSRLEALMGDARAGDVLRAATEDDERQAAQQAARAAAILEGVPDALDCEVLLDGRTAVLQLAGPSATAMRLRAAALAGASGLELSVYDAGTPVEEEDSGCGSGGCGTGGGCGSGGCGSGGCGGETSDVRDYFASLRNQMEQARRVPLL